MRPFFLPVFAIGLSICPLGVSATELKPADNVQAVGGAANEAEADPVAQFALARAYLLGQGVDRDPAKAYEWMQKSAAQGYPEAEGGLGYFYATGTVVAKDEQEAIRWFRKGAEKGVVRAQYNLGKTLLDSKSPDANWDEGRTWMQKAADAEMLEALVDYGHILYLGEKGGSTDRAAAFPYLLKAAEAGHKDAQNTMGVIYQFGQMRDIDLALAEYWYRQAANQGHARAQSNLGAILGPETDDPERRVEALMWLLIAGNQDEITARKRLAELLLGVRANEIEEARKRADQFFGSNLSAKKRMKQYMDEAEKARDETIQLEVVPVEPKMPGEL